VIDIITVGNDGVDAIVAARELNDDENLFTRLGLCGNSAAREQELGDSRRERKQSCAGGAALKKLTTGGSCHDELHET